ncbi:MAG: hypothetical protein JHC20_01595 [Pyrobaculum sp.]|nr:hypothetical protein [Pyrobaculum sp.]
MPYLPWGRGPSDLASPHVLTKAGARMKTAEERLVGAADHCVHHVAGHQHGAGAGPQGGEPWLHRVGRRRAP